MKWISENLQFIVLLFTVSLVYMGMKNYKTNIQELKKAITHIEQYNPNDMYILKCENERLRIQIENINMNLQKINLIVKWKNDY